MTTLAAGSRFAVPRAAAHRQSGIVLFMGSHVLLALVLAPTSTAVVSTVHAIGSFLIALYLVIKAPLRWAVAGAGYIVGAEVLWRMTGARVPWEYGKYASCLVLAVALWRLGRRARWRWLPLSYALLMLPSVAVLMLNPALRGEHIFERLSFNLSGPLTIALSVWCLSQFDLREEGEDRALLAILAPLMTTGLVALVRTIAASDLTFTAESNLATSGGFGPNQVSVVLGLGALLALLYALRNRGRARGTMPALALTVFLGMQTALTLSRGGLYGFAFAAMAVLALLLRNARVRRRALWLVLPALLLAIAVILPRINSFTGGALSARFEDRQSSGRFEIVKEDLRIWGEHALVGAGPGGARELRRTASSVTHTEYTRLLAEHGLFGLAALAVLGLMSVNVLRGVARGAYGASNVGLLVWSLASMSHAGMRIAAIGFIFGLAHARFGSRRSAAATPGRASTSESPRLARG